jgi:hypothetical protein
VKRLAILAVAVAIGLAFTPASWKWGTHRAYGDDTVVVMVTTSDGQQFVASTAEPQPPADVYTADVVTEGGTSFAGATVEVLTPEEIESLGDPVAELDMIDSWSW